MNIKLLVNHNSRASVKADARKATGKFESGQIALKFPRRLSAVPDRAGRR
jgi:hypothetical protein